MQSAAVVVACGREREREIPSLFTAGEKLLLVHPVSQGRWRGKLQYDGRMYVRGAGPNSIVRCSCQSIHILHIHRTGAA